MRVWIVVALLAVIVGVTLALRTRAGWEPTELERLDILCGRGFAANCTLLGLRLLEGSPGDDDMKRGLGKLGLGCSLGDSNGCYLHGSNALRLGGSDAPDVAAKAFAKGCMLRNQDSCAYEGWLKRRAPKEQRDLTGGRTLLVGACGNGSALGCTWLGEIALEEPSSPSDRASASRSFEKGCELGNDWGCLRAAQAWACGRGVEEDREASLELLTKLCDDGLEAACDQLLALEPDGELTVDDEATERAVMRGAFLAAKSGDREQATRFAEALEGHRELLARAAVAITFDNLDQAEALLAELPRDAGAGVGEFEVARQTLAVVKEGKSFPEAAWLGWARAGRPDLRKPQLIPALSESSDRGACRPQAAIALETPEAFLKAVALANERSFLDGPFDQNFARAAMRFSGSQSLPVRLAALAVLKQVAASKADDATAEFEAAARHAFAAEEDGTLFSALLKLPADLHGAASPAELEALERAITLPADWPRREVYDAFARALGPGKLSGERAYSATVFVFITLLEGDALSDWLERGGHDLRRRARVLRGLGERLSEDEWLVHRYGGVRLLRASNALVPDDALTGKIESAEARLTTLRTGPGGYQAMGLWPWPQLTNQPEVHIEHEIRELERLEALAAGHKP